MRLNVQWMDEPELFEAVASSLTEGYPDFHSTGSEEQDEYGNRGYIRIDTQDGRRFYLQLVQHVR